MDKMLDILSQMPQTSKILKAGTFVQEGSDEEIESDAKRILKRDDNESGQTYKQYFTIAATEWSTNRTLKVTLRKVILPYVKPADPSWVSD